MNPDGYIRPELAAERANARRIRKRMQAVIEREGVCCICIYRNREQKLWGRSICQIGEQRQHPACSSDGKSLRFWFDAETLPRFQDAPEGS